MAVESNLQQHTDIYAQSGKWRFLALTGALLAWMFDGVEQGVYTVMTRPALTDLLPDGANESFYFGLAAAFWLWGAAVGGVVFGAMGDRYGRVRSLVLAVVTYSVFTGLSALSQHGSHFLICRMLGALGLGGAWPLSVAIIVETWPDKYRSVLAGLMGAGANVGFFIAGMYTGYMLSLDFHWRWVVGMGFVLGMISLPLLLILPESGAWKASRAKKQHTSVSDLFTPKFRRSTIVGTLLSTVALLGAWGAFLWLSAYADQIAEGTEFASTAKSTVMRWQAFGQMAGGFMGGVIAALMGGNKRSWIFLCITAWASVFFLFYLNQTFTYQMCWMGALAGLFVTAYFGWLPKYLPELYPTRIRATGQGFAYNMGRVITGFLVLAGGTLASIFNNDYRLGAMVLSFVYLLGLIVIVFAPDTGGKMMSDDE